MSDPAAAPAERERVFLVVVDDTPEMRVALRYAARRARHVGGRVVLLYVFEPTDRQHWMALESLMRQEKQEEAEAIMQKIAAEAHALTGRPPVVYIREGQTGQELLKLIEEDPTISILVLAAGLGDTGPGPLVSTLASKYAARLRVPLTIVPGSLSDADLDAIT